MADFARRVVMENQGSGTQLAMELGRELITIDTLPFPILKVVRNYEKGGSPAEHAADAFLKRKYSSINNPVFNKHPVFDTLQPVEWHYILTSSTSTWEWIKTYYHSKITLKGGLKAKWTTISKHFFSLFNPA